MHSGAARGTNMEVPRLRILVSKARLQQFGGSVSLLDFTLLEVVHVDVDAICAE
jgi:hypothetical protein